MLDRPRSGDVVVLVCVAVKPALVSEEERREFCDLALAAGVVAAESIFVNIAAITAKFFVGSGKAEGIRQLVLFHQANVVIFNCTLSPAQTRNLEQLFSCRVLDRTDLILDIFAQRARSFEGKLQVELAQLTHLSTRLVRGWSHLERQKGGIGLRGPGETQLEVDRRLIRLRIKAITHRLAKVEHERNQRRRARQKADVVTIALVGYTNAGKTTLFNALSGAQAYAADQLFATLDPTIRQMSLPHVGKVVLADTVGFIRNLPHELIKAFHATLEETRAADLLLHVVDASDPQLHEKIAQVESVLTAIDAQEVPRLLVYNKIDLLAPQQNPGIDWGVANIPLRVWVSASNGQGMIELNEVLSAVLGRDIIQTEIHLDMTQGRLRHRFYEERAVLQETLQLDGTYLLVVRLARRKLDALLRE